MSIPTWTEGWAQFKNCIKIFDEIDKFGRVNATNYLGLESTYIATPLKIDGNEGAQALGALVQVRANLASCLVRTNLESTFLPHLRTLAKVMGVPEDDAQGIISRLNDFMQTNNYSIKARNFTRGSWTSGSPYVGNGTIYRLTVDRYNNRLEASFVDVITGTIVADGNSGVGRGQETWEFRGKKNGSDALELEGTNRGSGINLRINAKGADDSILSNATFLDYTGSSLTTPTDITSWTSNVTVNSTNYEILEGTANTYRTAKSEGTTPRAVKIKVTANLSQKLSLRNAQIESDKPYFVQIAWNRLGTGTGTLVLRLGSQNVSVAVVAQAGWQLLKLPIDQNLYPDNFNADDLALSIEWTRTGGDIAVDDLQFYPFERMDGVWVIPVGGSTHWLLNDTGTFTDTATESIIQRHFWKAFGRSIRAVTGGGETIADP